MSENLVLKRTELNCLFEKERKLSILHGVLIQSCMSWQWHMCTMYPAYLRCYRTVFSSLWQQIQSSQNAPARQQANQVNEQTRGTVAERSASDTWHRHRHHYCISSMFYTSSAAALLQTVYKSVYRHDVNSIKHSKYCSLTTRFSINTKWKVCAQSTISEHVVTRNRFKACSKFWFGRMQFDTVCKKQFIV